MEWEKKGGGVNMVKWQKHADESMHRSKIASK